MIEIREVVDPILKSEITDDILRKLPNWFGIETSIQEYINEVKYKIFYAAYDKGNAVGFLCLRHVNPYTAEIYVTGILEQHHRQGIGTKMVGLAEDYLKKHGYQFMMVKTVGESCDDAFYARTRAFYISVGFYPLEELKEIWNEENPCLIMVKSLI